MFVTYCYEVEAGGHPLACPIRLCAVCRQRRRRRLQRPDDHVDAASGDLVASTGNATALTTSASRSPAWLPRSPRSLQHIHLEQLPNGGAVMRRDRSTQQASIVFVRVAE
jgi:hypothetical protein